MTLPTKHQKLARAAQRLRRLAGAEYQREAELTRRGDIDGATRALARANELSRQSRVLVELAYADIDAAIRAANLPNETLT